MTYARLMKLTVGGDADAAAQLMVEAKRRSDRRGVIAALLAQPPDAETWTEICEVIEAVEPALREGLVGWMEPQLERWPEALRVVPRSWLLQALRGDGTPLASVGRTLRLSGLGGEADVLYRLSRSSLLRSITDIRLDLGGVAAQEVAHLLSSPYARGLRRLDLGWNNFGPEDGMFFSEMVPACELRELSLEANAIGDRAASALVESPLFSGLERLSLARAGISALTCTVLARSEIATGLRELSLAHNRLGSRGLLRLSSRDGLTLRRLNLGGNTLGVQGAYLLAETPWLSSTRRLGLNNNDLGDEGLDALLEHPLESLSSLSVGWNGISDAGVGRLAEHPLAERLEHLYLSGNHITDVGARALAESSRFPASTSLVIERNDLSPEGVAALERRFRLIGRYR